MRKIQEQITRPTPKSGGLANALWILAKPTPRVSIEPAASAVRYSEARRRGIAPLCDIYRPQTTEPGLAPSVLLLHGGAFVARLAQAGIGVCSVDYRLLFRGGGISQALEDVAQASAFWRQVAANYGCGPNSSMMGLSAGATLMLLHASATQERYMSLVNAYGATDFSSVRGKRATFVMRLVHGTQDRELWKARSPLYSAPIQSPVLNLHGREDQMVPVEHSIRFHNDRVDRGLASELELYDDAPHGWLCDTTRAESEPSLARSARFILDHSER